MGDGRRAPLFTAGTLGSLRHSKHEGEAEANLAPAAGVVVNRPRFRRLDPAAARPRSSPFHARRSRPTLLRLRGRVGDVARGHRWRAPGREGGGATSCEPQLHVGGCSRPVPLSGVDAPALGSGPGVARGGPGAARPAFARRWGSRREAGQPGGHARQAQPTCWTTRRTGCSERPRVSASASTTCSRSRGDQQPLQLRPRCGAVASRGRGRRASCGPLCLTSSMVVLPAARPENAFARAGAWAPRRGRNRVRSCRVPRFAATATRCWS